MTENNDNQTGTETFQAPEKPEQLEFSIPGIEKKEVPETSPTQRDIEMKRSIEEAFDALVPGMKISVTRLKPKWAAGWVDTFDVEFDEDNNPVIDLGEIKEAYGGEKLMLRFLNSRGRYLWANTIDFKAVPPRDNGVEIENPRIKELKERIALERAQQAQKTTNDNQDLLRLVMAMQEKSHEQIISAMKSNLKESKPLGQLDEMIAAMDKIEALRGKQAPAPHGGDISGMLSGLMAMLGSGQFSLPAPSAAPPKPQRTTPPQKPVRMPPTGIIQNVVPLQKTAAAQPPEPVEPISEADHEDGDDSEDDSEDLTLVEEMETMDDSEIAETVAELLGRIGEERAAKIFEHFHRLSTAKAQ